MLFIDPPGRHRTRLRWATPLLLLVCSASALVLALLEAPAREAVLQRWGALSAASSDWRLLLQADRIGGLFSALGLHASASHLIGNLIFLLVFGLPTERALGPWRLLLLFILGGALANFIAAVSMDRPDRVILGASGAVSVLIGAYLVLYPRARLGVVLPLGLWLQFVRMPASVLILLWALMQLLFTWAGPSFGAVAWWAHLSGFLIGLLAAFALRGRLLREARLQR